MKTLKKLYLLITLILTFNGYAQKVDFINAPLNPIAVKYKLEHFNLKGDVYGYDHFIFSESGYLISSNELVNSKVFIYDENNRLLHNTEGETYKYNDQGYIAEQTYAHLGKKTIKFHYNPKGLLIKKEHDTYSTIYEYDSLNRIIKQISNIQIINYTYKKEGDVLYVEENKTNGEENFNTIKHAFRNGHRIAFNTVKFEPTFDKHGNTSIAGFNQTILYSELANTPELSLIYKKSSYRMNDLSNCKLYVNNKIVNFLNTRLINDKDVMVYNPFQENYMIIRNALDEAKSGKKQVFETIYLNTYTYLQATKKSYYLFYKGISISNKFYLRNKSLKIYNQFNNAICYDDFLDKTFFVKMTPNLNEVFLPLEELQSEDNIFFMINDETKIFVEKGMALKNSEYTFAYNNNDFVLFKNNEPLYYFPNLKNAEKEMVHPGRKYNKTTDTYQIAKKNTETPKNISTCLSGNCINGYGELKTDEYILKGFFKNGKANGFGKQTFSNNANYYEGNFVDGFRNGFGMFIWHDTKQYYIGQFKNGTFHGYGYLKKGGEILQAGYYEKGKQTRNMITTNFKNKRAVGNCIGDCSNGFGFYQFANRDTYVGFFTNGQLDKVGAYGWTSGDSYIGEIQNKNFSGQGVQYYKSSGTTYYGNFSSGQRNGLGVYLDKNKQIINKGYWVNGTLKTAY
ncbi:hypothetical protein J1D01_07635 [Seonamhaeicola sp. NFXS20]|uniref:hypothetical protein n=1 Tax=Seonamhaeicola sp. NFXS20 TaxID=2816959 RepID=UPI003B8B60C6